MTKQGFDHFFADLLFLSAELVKSYHRFFTTLGGINGYEHRTTR